MSETTKAIGYCPTSVIDKDLGESIETQRRYITKYAKRQNLEIVEWFEQIGYEPLTFPLSKLDEALEYCKENPDIKYLIVLNSERIAYPLEEYVFWKTSFERTGVSIVYSDSSGANSPEERLHEIFLQTIRQYDHEIREKKDGA